MGPAGLKRALESGACAGKKERERRLARSKGLITAVRMREQRWDSKERL